MSAVPAVGLGFDVHPFGTEGTLVLGGVRFEGEPALAGHSDGDVVTHAVADALLGAAGMGDLGSMFPASEAQYAGADSLELLRQVVARVREEYWVGNVDVVIAAEHPKLGPAVEAMQANLREAVGERVTVKPKFAEGLGTIGRGEGIAAWAIACLGR